jgi:hypothetical protein
MAETLMRRLVWFFVPVLLLAIYATTLEAKPPQQAGGAVYATIETTLATEAKQIRMFAMDGDPGTYFVSATNPTSNDHFTLVLDKPVMLKSISVSTGKADGQNKLESGVIEVSEDGTQWTTLAKVSGGMATANQAKAVELKAIRIKPADDMKHPLAIGEITIESTPPVASYKYPVEYILDVADAPDMKEWGDKVVRLCERSYQWIGDELQSPGYKPPTVVTMALKKSYKGVAAAGGGKITGSVDYFKRNPKDTGAMVHETVHIIQRYQGAPKNTGWLVEGIADYIRFIKYEPENIGKLNVNTAKYNGSYRVSARFLAYVADKYDKELVRKLNRALREKSYSEAMWKDLTGKALTELGEEWVAGLKKAVSTISIRSCYPDGPTNLLLDAGDRTWNAEAWAFSSRYSHFLP